MNDEQGWLIERNIENWQPGENRTEWLGINSPILNVIPDTFFFSHNANNALRFARKIDAESFVKFIGLAEEVTITSHSWCLESNENEGVAS